MCLCGLYPEQRINAFRITIGPGMAAREAAREMNGRGCGQFVSVQVAVVVCAAVLRGGWNVSLLCET